MAAARRGTRRPGKSDPIDAEAVAPAALRHPDLPVAELDGPTRALTVEINALEAELRPLVRRLAPALLAVPGCGYWVRR
jgi:hypothetical protein